MARAAFEPLRTICETASIGNTVPGLVVAIGRDGHTEYVEAFGLRQREPEPAAATPDTVYDLASLTKALATALLTVQAVAEGKVRLDDPVRRWVPAFRGERKDRVTMRELLAHASGLPAHRPLYEQVLEHGAPPPDQSVEALRARVVTLAAEEPLAYEPGSKSVYSDLGFILLGAALESALGGRLDVLARDRIFGPLGVPGLHFRPTDAGSSPAGPPPIAPTERCPVRRRLLHGEVHDLNAFALGGVAGHAGLFGQAPDVAALAAVLCRLYCAPRVAGRDSDVLDPVTLRAFASRAGIPGSTWRLGWDGPAPSGSLAGSLLSRDAIGHLGFTGCSLWIDLARGFFVVMASNRVHPNVPAPSSDAHEAFKKLRPAVMDAALTAVGYLP